MGGEKHIARHSLRANQVGESLFCLCLISLFLPVKIYPLFFLVSGSYFLWQTGSWPTGKWFWALTLFAAYSLLRVAIAFDGQSSLLAGELKLLVNLFFLASGAHWLKNRENQNLLPYVDKSLHVVLLLCLAQLLVYHHAWDYQLIFGGDSSGQTSRLYRERFFFWGLSDKNMFGARIALVGFVYILIPFVLHRKIVLWRILFVGLLAFLSLSRTPLVALMIGIFLLGWFYLPRKAKVFLILLLTLATPILAVKLLRVDQITASNDGMGVRLTYWRAFFEHFDAISVFGNGLNAGGTFLSKYARYYHGEPHVHNTFMTCYMDFGIIGLVTYTLFLGFYFKQLFTKYRSDQWVLLLLLPLLSIMMILYSGYDNDVVFYLLLISLLTSCVVDTGKTGRLAFR